MWLANKIIYNYKVHSAKIKRSKQSANNSNNNNNNINYNNTELYFAYNS